MPKTFTEAERRERKRAASRIATFEVYSVDGRLLFAAIAHRPLKAITAKARKIVVEQVERMLADSGKR